MARRKRLGKRKNKMRAWARRTARAMNARPRNKYIRAPRYIRRRRAGNRAQALALNVTRFFRAPPPEMAVKIRSTSFIMRLQAAAGANEENGWAFVELAPIFAGNDKVRVYNMAPDSVTNINFYGISTLFNVYENCRCHAMKVKFQAMSLSGNESATMAMHTILSRAELPDGHNPTDILMSPGCVNKVLPKAGSSVNYAKGKAFLKTKTFRDDDATGRYDFIENGNGVLDNLNPAILPYVYVIHFFSNPIRQIGQATNRTALFIDIKINVTYYARFSKRLAVNPY